MDIGKPRRIITVEPAPERIEPAPAEPVPAPAEPVPVGPADDRVPSAPIDR